jgi:hypothetical protein
MGRTVPACARRPVVELSRARHRRMMEEGACQYKACPVGLKAQGYTGLASEKCDGWKRRKVDS